MMKKIILFFVFYSFSNLAIWSVRGDRTLSLGYENFEEESRYLEFVNTIEVLRNNKNMVLGNKYAFDEAGRYYHKRPERPMHGTYSRILFGSGVLGLFIFFYYLVYILLNLFKSRSMGEILQSVVISSMLIYLVVLTTGASGIGVGASYVGTLFLLTGYCINNNLLYETRYRNSPKG